MIRMLPWSRFSALFLAAGIGVAEILNLVAAEPVVMRYSLMFAAVVLFAGVGLTDGKRRLGVLLGAWAYTAGVFATGLMIVFDHKARFILDQAPTYLPRMGIGLALAVLGIATVSVAISRRSGDDIRLPDDTQYR